MLRWWATAWTMVCLAVLGGNLIAGACQTNIEGSFRTSFAGQGALPANDWIPVFQMDINSGGSDAIRFGEGDTPPLWSQIYQQVLFQPNPFRIIFRPESFPGVSPEESDAYMAQYCTDDFCLQPMINFVEVEGAEDPVPVLIPAPPTIPFTLDQVQAGQFPTVLGGITGRVTAGVGGVGGTFDPSIVSYVALAVEGILDGAVNYPVCDPDVIAQRLAAGETLEEIAYGNNIGSLATLRSRGLVRSNPFPAADDQYDPINPIIAIAVPDPQTGRFEFEPYMEFTTFSAFPVPEAEDPSQVPGFGFLHEEPSPMDLPGLTPDIKAGLVNSTTYATEGYNVVAPNRGLELQPGLDIIVGNNALPGDGAVRRYYLLVKLNAKAFHGQQIAVSLDSVEVINGGNPFDPDRPEICLTTFDLAAARGLVEGDLLGGPSGDLLAQVGGDLDEFFDTFWFTVGAMGAHPITIVENAGDLTPIGVPAGAGSVFGPGGSLVREQPHYPPRWPGSDWGIRNHPPKNPDNLLLNFDRGVSTVYSETDATDGVEQYRNVHTLTNKPNPVLWAPESELTQVMGIELAGGAFGGQNNERRTALTGLLMEFISPGLITEIPADGIDNNANAFWMMRNGIDDNWNGEDNDGNPWTPAVADGIDNDGDGLIDEGIDEWGEGIDEFYMSPDMLEDNDNNPFTPPVADGIDNDGDGLIDEVHHLATGNNQITRPLVPTNEVRPGRNDDGDSYVEIYPGFPQQKSMRLRTGGDSSPEGPWGWMPLFDAGIDLPVIDTFSTNPFTPPRLGELDPFDLVNTAGLVNSASYQMTMGEFMHSVRGMPVPPPHLAHTPMGRVLTLMDDDGDGYIDEDPLDGIDNDGDGLIDEDTYNWQLVMYDDDGDGLIDEDPMDGVDNDGDGFIDEDIGYSPILVNLSEEINNYFVDMPGGTAGIYDPSVDQYYMDFNMNGVYDRGGHLTRDEFVNPGPMHAAPLLRQGQWYNEPVAGGFGTIIARPIDDDGDAESLYIDRIDNDGDSHDHDGDGYPTGQELAMGTDPYSFGSRPQGPPDPAWMYIDEGFNEDVSDPDFSPTSINENLLILDADDVLHHRTGVQLYANSVGAERVGEGDGMFNANDDEPNIRTSFGYQVLPLTGAYDELNNQEELAGRFGVYLPVQVFTRDDDDDDDEEEEGVDADGVPWNALPPTNNGEYDFFLTVSLDSDDSTGSPPYPGSHIGVNYGADWTMRIGQGGYRLSTAGAPATGRRIQSVQGCVFNETDPLDETTILGLEQPTFSMDGYPFAAMVLKRQVAGLHIINVHSPSLPAMASPSGVGPRTRRGAVGPLWARANIRQPEQQTGSGGRTVLTPLQEIKPLFGLNVAILDATQWVSPAFAQETINSIRINFVNVPTDNTGPADGAGVFMPTDLAPLDPDPFVSGIGLVRDVPESGTSAGEMQFGDILNGAVRLNIQQSRWNPDPNDPVVLNGGHYVILTPQEPIELPLHDYGDNMGADFFITVRASASAHYRNTFQAFIRPGDIDFRNKRNSVSSYVISHPISIGIPLRHVDLIPGGKSVKRRSDSFAVLGMDLADVNRTFRGEPTRLATLTATFNDVSSGTGALRFNPETDLMPMTNDIVPVSQIRPDLFPPETTSPDRVTTLSGVAVFRDAPGSDTIGGFDDPLDPNVVNPDTPVRLSGEEDYTDRRFGTGPLVHLLLDPPSVNYDPDWDGVFHNDLSPDRRGRPGGEHGFDNVDLNDPDIFDPDPYARIPDSRVGENAGPDYFLVLRTSELFVQGKQFRVGLGPYEDAEFVYPGAQVYPYAMNNYNRPFPLTMPQFDNSSWAGMISSVITAEEPFNAAPFIRFISPPQFSAANPDAVFHPDRTAPLRQRPLRVLWDDSDPDDNATVALYYTNLRTGQEVLLTVKPEDPDGISGNILHDAYDWDISRLAPGMYQLRLTISDNVNPVMSILSQKILVRNDLPTMQIVNPRALPAPNTTTSGQQYTITWNAFDYENDARISLWLDPSPTRPTTAPSAGAVPIATGISEDEQGQGGSFTVDVADLVRQGTLAIGGVYWVVAVIDDGVTRIDPDSGATSDGKVFVASQGRIEIDISGPTPTTGPTTPTPTPVNKLEFVLSGSDAQNLAIRRTQNVVVRWDDLQPVSGATRTLYWLPVGETPPLNVNADPLPPQGRIMRSFDGTLAQNLSVVPAGQFLWDYGAMEPGGYRAFQVVRIPLPGGSETQVRTVGENVITVHPLRWPLQFSARSLETSPLLTDLTGDGRQEIVVVTDDGALSAYTNTGRRVGRVMLGVRDIASSPVAVDVLRGGRPLIAVGAPGERLLVADLLNEEHWTIQLGDHPAGLVGTTPAVADVNRDGFMDVVVASDSGWAYIVLGRPNGKLASSPAAAVNLGAPIVASPVVGNLKTDSGTDILLANNKGELFVLDSERVLAGLQGLTKIASLEGQLFATPLLHDVNGDGLDEIFVALADGSASKRGRVYLLNGQGESLAPGGGAISDLVLPRSTQPVRGALAMGRISHPERPQLVVANSESVLIYDIAADEDNIEVTLVDRVQGAFSLSAPVIGSVTRGEEQHIVLGGRLNATQQELVTLVYDPTTQRVVPSSLSTLVAAQLQGVMQSREVTGRPALIGSAALADLHRNGVAELLVAFSNGMLTLATVDADAMTPLRSDWPQLKGNDRRTGRFGDRSGPPPPGDLDGDGEVDFADLFTLARRWKSASDQMLHEGGPWEIDPDLVARIDSETLLRFIRAWNIRR